MPTVANCNLSNFYDYSYIKKLYVANRLYFVLMLNNKKKITFKLTIICKRDKKQIKNITNIRNAIFEKCLRNKGKS